MFRNKLDKNGDVVRNKARLVTKRYNQDERIDFNKIYSPVARLEVIRLLFIFVCYMNFKQYQMDVKNIFLNKYITKEVFIE